jgi:transcriptional regulator GlxA family with amidase domain
MTSSKRSICRAALEKRFRKHLNRSPKQEIRRIRLERIKQLLVETDLTLERIAELSGFEHPEYMSVLFKRETGQTPGHYRNQFKTAAAQPKSTAKRSTSLAQGATLRI